MPKILFIQPTQYDTQRGLCKQKRIHLPGLAFPLLAALTPAHWEVEAVIEVVDTVPLDTDADIVALSAMGHAVFRGLELASEFKKRGKTVIMGGYMASLACEEVSRHVDSVVVGDAELAYPELLGDFEHNRPLKPIYHTPLERLENLPLPRYELLTRKPIGAMLPVQAGRGCPMHCSFCSIACMYKGTYLFRPVREVIRDIRAVKSRGFSRFYLIDDNIASNTSYLSELCDAIRPLKMHWASQCALHLAHQPDVLKKVVESGGELMSFGIESLNQEGLNLVNKSWLDVNEHAGNIRILQKAGITVSTEMIVGIPGDTPESIGNIASFIDSTRISIPRAYILTPIPGTQLFIDYKKKGKLLTEDFKEYDGSKAVFTPDSCTAEELTEAYWMLNRAIFSLSSIFKRIICNPTLWKKPHMLIFALFVNLHYRSYIRRHVVPNIF
jgi:radical SAM superfamily enzyme YgiQ (UPF0313 family)